jgi:predicted phage baseplate assembly protein
LVQIEDSEYEAWTEVEDFSQSTSQDKHFVCDTATGEIKFGPSIRQPDGEAIQYGAVPPKNKMVKLSSYRYGGGSIGNVGRNTLTVLKSSIPYVAAVTNRRAATGGTDPESIENAKLRGPQIFRTRNRAITESDFEYLALEASSAVARAKCVQPRELGEAEGPPPGMVMLLLIPVVSSTEGRIPASELELTRGIRQEVQTHLDDRRLLSTMVEIGEPSYHWVSIDARVKAKSGFDPMAVEQDIERELFHFINPLTGGPERNGWPFGRDLIISEIYSCIQQRVPGVEYVEEAQIFPVDISSNKRGEATQRLVIPATGVMCSHVHSVTMF